jgi:transcription elongation factor Elf1
MSEPLSSFFNCPACGAGYKVVRMEAPLSETSDEQVECRNCGGPLDAHDGAFILKYFLVGPSKKGRRKK